MSDRSRSRSPLEGRSRSRSPARSRPRNMQSKRCIISNIPYEMKWQDVKDLFRKEVGDVMYVELFQFPDGKSKGAGVVEFKDKETAAYAIEKMHRSKVKDRSLVVREERERDRQQNMGGGGMMSGPGGGMGSNMGGMMGGGGGMMGGGGGMMGGGGGVNPQVLQQLGVDGPVTNTVFVSNLDYKVTWKKLKDVFRLAGNVQRAEIKTDNSGKSRGMGTVTFDLPVEAVQAISMFNNQSLYDRNMRVKMDSQGGGEKSASVQLPSGLKSIGMGLGAGGTPIQNMNNMSGMDSGMGMGGGSGMGMGMGSGGMGGGSGMGMGGSGMGMGGGMDSQMRSGMGSSMGSGMSGMGNMGSSMMGMGSMSGGMGSMSGGMGSNGMGSSSMGSGMGGSGMGMGDSFSSPMSGMGSSSYMNSSMGGGMNDSFNSMGSMSGMGNSSGFSSMMDNTPGRGMNSGSFNRSSDYGGRDRDRMGRDSDKLRDMKTRPDDSTIIVKNLPYSYSWQTLRDKFREVGEIKFAEIKTENGRSAGWGLVRFNNQEDAMRAIEMMNCSKFDGREVDVRMFR